MNQSELNTNARATPAAMLTLAITSGTAIGNTIAPARGVMATNQRKAWLGSDDFRTTQLWLRLRDCCCPQGSDVGN